MDVYGVDRTIDGESNFARLKSLGGENGIS